MGIFTSHTLLTLFITALLLVAGPALAVETAAAPSAGASDPASAPPERAMVTSGLDSEAVARANPQQAVWLDAGDSGRVLGLLEPEQTPSPNGALILLNDEGLSADAGIIGALRQPLAAAGWAAMSLGLPMPAYALQKARQVAAESPPAPSPEAPATADTAPKASDSVMIDVMEKGLKGLTDAYRKQLRERLQAAIDELAKRGYSPIVLLGLGQGADVITRDVAANRPSVSALIWLAPSFQTGRDQPLTELMKTVNQPVLELFSQREQSGDARQRRALMNRSGYRQYWQQPVAMALPPVRRDAAQVAARVTAWLAR